MVFFVFVFVPFLSLKVYFRILRAKIQEDFAYNPYHHHRDSAS